MSYTLFNTDPYLRAPKDELDPRYGQHPVLQVLELRLGDLSPNYSRYLRIYLKRGAHVFDPGTNLSTTEGTEGNFKDDNIFGWSRSPRSDKVIDGYLKGAFQLDDIRRRPVLHLSANITDIDGARFAVALEDIDQIGSYPEHVEEVQTAFQNAEVDGDASWWQQHKGYGLEPILTFQDLEPYVTSYWPEPAEIIYRATD